MAQELNAVTISSQNKLMTGYVIKKDGLNNRKTVKKKNDRTGKLLLKIYL